MDLGGYDSSPQVHPSHYKYCTLSVTDVGNGACYTHTGTEGIQEISVHSLNFIEKTAVKSKVL